MKFKGNEYRTIWFDGQYVKIIDQTKLPHKFEIITLKSVLDAAKAIKDMQVRGAGLIGVTAAYGMYLAALEEMDLNKASKILLATRPTAANLKHAVNVQLKNASTNALAKVALKIAQKLAEEDFEMCRSIGKHGFKIINKLKQPVNIMTHCNAGWLAFVDYGSATAPIYEAFNKGINLHVWVSETRPRNQGALTAWELNEQGVRNTFITDNASGHLMQRGMVDMVIVGADRVVSNGDVANKIGTYMKAVVANDNKVPFYVAFPSTTIDWDTRAGKDIPIEQRSADEVKFLNKSKITDSDAVNYAFDVTPARLITGFITDKGIIKPNELSGIR